MTLPALLDVRDTPAVKERTRIDSIQVLRGLAALLVLLHHAAFKLHRFDVSPLNWLHTGDVGVDVFFLVSGFVMCHSVRGRHQHRGAIAAFLEGRLLRILPLYWLLTLVALGVFLWRPGMVNSSGGTTDVLRSFLLLPTDHKYLVENGWTLTYEFWFYGVFSLGLLLPRAKGRLLVLALLLCLGVAGFFLDPSSPAARVATNQLMLEFAAGMALYLAWERGWRLPGWARLAIALAAVVIWMPVNAGHGLGLRILDYGLPATLLCTALVLGSGPLAGGNWPSVARWLGDISYSLYLVHPFTLAATALILRPVVAGAGAGWAAGLAMVGLSLLAADQLWRRVERPLHRLATRVASRA